MNEINFEGECNNDFTSYVRYDKYIEYIKFNYNIYEINNAKNNIISFIISNYF